MLRKLGFYSAFILPLITIIGFYLGEYWNALTPVFVFVVLPILDQLVGLDTKNVPPEEVKTVNDDSYYRFITYGWVYIQLIFLVWAIYVIVTTSNLSTLSWIGFTLSVGLVTGGIGITVAHELGHKNSTLERFYSKVLLMTVSYMHFYIEHNRGHHVTVATPADPATAKKNQHFYSFWFQSVVQGYLHAWKLEKESLNRKQQKTFSWHNMMIYYTLLPFAFCFLLILAAKIFTGNWYSVEISLFFFSQSIVAFTLLELVNYIEHYGILRRKISDDKYERVNPLHSWNASQLLSNFFLFQLQRHSDHHAYAHKRYQVLNHYDESPQLPFGYPTMILLALVPSIWFRLMNKRLEKWELSVRKSPLIT